MALPPRHSGNVSDIRAKKWLLGRVVSPQSNPYNTTIISSHEEWRDEMEEWRGSIEVRLEGDHEMLQLIPEVLERLGPQTVTTEQQTNIRGMVKRLNELTSIPYQTIYWELAQAFQAPRYNEIVESQYPAVCDWFQRRIEAAKAPMPKKSHGQA